MSHADHIVDACTKMLTSRDGMFRTQQGKRLLVLVWKTLPKEARTEFMRRLNDDLEFVPAYCPTKEEREDADLERALSNWPKVLDGDLDEVSRDFARDVDKRRRWKNWNPSEKQRAWIMRLWSEHGTEAEEVIEEA